MTIKRKNQPTELKNLFNHQHSQFTNILHKAQFLHKLNQILTETVTHELTQHCYIVDFNGTQLILAVDNSAWATTIKLNTPEIINELKKNSMFVKLKAISCKIQSS